MENTKKQNNIETEKKIIVYLITLVVLLLYISIFFICDIIDRGTINVSDTTAIEYPDNNVSDDSDIDTNGGYGSGVNQNLNANQNLNVRANEDYSIKFFEDSNEWKTLKQLKIFEGRHLHVVDNKIAPGVQDTYVYTVECYGNYPMVYDTRFIEENPYEINMVFKLKRNGVYVAGNESTWVKASDLAQYKARINGGTMDVYTLEWRWEDSPNDTEIGETEGANYKLSIRADAELAQ